MTDKGDTDLVESIEATMQKEDRIFEDAQKSADLADDPEWILAQKRYLRKLDLTILPMISTLYFFEYLDRGNIAVSQPLRHLHWSTSAEKIRGFAERETLRLRQRSWDISIRNRSRSKGFVRHAMANGHHDLLRRSCAFPSPWLHRLPRVSTFESSLRCHGVTTSDYIADTM
jgi:hypothetical protein